MPPLILLCPSAGPDLVPTAVFQNGRKCMLVNVGGAAFVNAKSPAAGGGGTERAETPVRLSGPNIIGVDGNVLAMKGLNWFGFDVSRLFSSSSSSSASSSSSSSSSAAS